ncbi:hypothetical protein SAMN06265373_104448 [Shimia sagamensis]|uniref:Uncharacterized protein n=2 Tax=Shimia sagamensis TaxID=1566352 RepID=A0ABY1P3G7_9RHOB|nr:hypothetical protein SAMN06265373_104448 [Shimia sagamensis]
MWTYPWDIADIGQKAVSSELRELGFDMISLATVYHAGRFLQVRSPKRRAYFPEDGTLYFRPDASIWQGQAVQPLVSSLAQEQDVLRGMIEARDAGGLDVSCWTVCLHNSALGFAKPDLVTRNAFGDANSYNLCPANPEAQAYVGNLVQDISRNYQPNRIELESPNFLGFAHEYHHEKDMVGLPPEGDFLMALCFCEHCQEAGQAAGLDMPALQARVRGLIDQMCTGGTPQRVCPDFPERGLDAFEFDAELRAYLDLRFDHVKAVLAQAKEACAPSSELMLIDGQAGWLGGCDHKAAAELGLKVMLCAYDMGDEAALGLASYASALPQNAGGQVGLRLGYPEFDGAAAFAERIKLLRDNGATGVNLYNYGLVPKARLDWVRGCL